MPRKLPLENLLVAAKSGDKNCFSYLMDDLRLYEPSAELVRAIVHSDPGLLRATDDSGATPLHVACGNVENVPHELLELLVHEYPQALEMQNKFGLLPIHKAVAAFTAKKSIPNITFVAKSYLPGLMTRSKDGQLPLHIALHEPKLYTVALVETLVQLEPAAVRMADKYGQFPLHKAAIKPKADPGIVTVLLDAAAEVATMKDLNGSLPLHLALSRDQPNLEVVYLLVGAYPEGLFDPDYEDQLPYDKLIQRSVRNHDVGQEILALMEFTRSQINSRKPKLVRVPSPNLR